MAIRLADINPAQHTDPFSGKTLKEITQTELDLWNLDMAAIAAQYASDTIRAALEECQREILIMTRAVMYSSTQPYGGANALGDEICIRLMRPVDLGITADIWDKDLSGQSPPVSYTWISADAMGEEEGNLIIGFLDRVPLPGVSAYKVSKGGREYASFTLDFMVQDAEKVPFVKAMAPVSHMPEETMTIYTCCVRAVNPDRFQAVGVHAARASNLRTITS